MSVTLSGAKGLPHVHVRWEMLHSVQHDKRGRIIPSRMPDPRAATASSAGCEAEGVCTA